MANETQVEIQRLAIETIRVPIIGMSPLVMHRFSEKAKRKMLDAMRGQKTVKEPKDPEGEYAASIYYLKDGRIGFPAVAFKSCAISAARSFSAVTMVGLRQMMFFRGEPGDDGQQLFPIEGKPEMREDVVTVNRGGSDLRYRAMFEEWSTTLQITYTKQTITRDSVLSLLDAGGFSVGIGEWRPEKKGDFGTFMVDPTRDPEVIEERG